MFKEARLLIVEDEPNNRESLYEMLSDRFSVTTAVDGIDGVQKARQSNPDLILMDILMPKCDGFSACKALRVDPVTQFIPILFLSGMDTEDSRIEAFTIGADDFIAKPFGKTELLARISSKLTRFLKSKASQETISYGNLILDLPKMEVSIAGSVIQVSKLEFNLLKYFVENQERVLTRKQILDEVWNDAVVSDRTVDTHIACLRKKLAGFDRSLATVYGAGYILKSK